MAPDSTGTELVTVVAALALFWNRTQGWRRIVLRGVSLLACVVTSVAFAGSWVNRQVDFWPSWTAEHDTARSASRWSAGGCPAPAYAMAESATEAPGWNMLI